MHPHQRTNLLSSSAVTLCCNALIGILAATTHGQRPQDNWYLDEVWTLDMAVTNGGLSEPYGVAVGPDGRIYIGDDGSDLVHAYLPDMTFSFSITNGFGGGLAFESPRGMICDRDGNLYVADGDAGVVFAFSSEGSFIWQFGSGDEYVEGQVYDGHVYWPIDVAIADNNDVYVLDLYMANQGVHVFDSNGSFLRGWGGYGFLDGQVFEPKSLAIAPDGNVYVCNPGAYWSDQHRLMKVFTPEGVFIESNTSMRWRQYGIDKGPTSVRFDASGVMHVVIGGIDGWADYWNTSHGLNFQCRDISWNTLSDLYYEFAHERTQEGAEHHFVPWPCNAVAPDGSLYVVNRHSRKLVKFARAMRGQQPLAYNAIPMPKVGRVVQRTGSLLVDIEFEVTDVDDAVLQVGALVFTNASESIAGCVADPTWAENTHTNLGPGIAANTAFQLTWNAGADWSTDLGEFCVAILAKDSRTDLLDIHYLNLPAEWGQSALRISRSPLIQSDFLQVFYWLLATGDADMELVNGEIRGVGDSYGGLLLCSGNGDSTADGRAFVYGKMHVREASTAEVDWAREAATPGSVEQWTPAVQVGGRPMNINEYGFDTGDWSTNAWWIVPLP